MEDIINLVFLIGTVVLLIAVFLINDKLKTLQYRLEQQIEQNDKLIKLLTKKENL